MCGRYAVYGDLGMTAHRPAIRTSGRSRAEEPSRPTACPLRFRGTGTYIQNYDARPTQDLPIYHPIAEEFNEPDVRLASWGLVPYHCRDIQAFRRKYSTINARAESIAGSRVYGDSFRARRCLVPMRGFYEWQSVAGGGKRRWYVRVPEEPVFACAGIWDRCRDESGAELVSFSIIVCRPNSLLAELHNSNPHMPVIIPAELQEAWLDPAAPSTQLVDLLEPFEDARMEAFPVANRAAGEDQIKPLGPPAPGSRELF